MRRKGSIGYFVLLTDRPQTLALDWRIFTSCFTSALTTAPPLLFT